MPTNEKRTNENRTNQGLGVLYQSDQSFRGEIFAKFDQPTNLGKVSYNANFQEKGIVLYVCLKQSIAKIIVPNPHDS